MHKTEQPVLTKSCDIYSLGAIMYKLLLGVQPSPQVLTYIFKNKL